MNSISEDLFFKWDELLDHAKEECVFGQPLNTALFKECMIKAFEELLLGKEPKEFFDSEEVGFIGTIFSYANMPAPKTGKNSILFDASMHAANDLAMAILYRDSYTIDDYRIHFNLLDDDEDHVRVFYDFKTGDLADYIEVVEIERGIWEPKYN